MIIGLLIVISGACIYYAVCYYIMKADLKNAEKQMIEIEQNPENNRILLLAHANEHMEQFLVVCNRYIQKNQQMRIFYENREQKLRRQIEAISHDLRTPLTAILGYLELLSIDNLNDDSKEALGVVRRKAKNLQHLITNFYDLSRLELEDYHLIFEEMEVSRFLKEGMLTYYSSLEERGLEIEVDCQETAMIRADKGAMERILNNMLQNAIRYARSYLKVSVKKRNDKEVQIIFENDTTDLKQEDVPHLFERFYMPDTARSGEGTGLGLTISKLLAEAMGGSARVQFEESVIQICYTFFL